MLNERRASRRPHKYLPHKVEMGEDAEVEMCRDSRGGKDEMSQWGWKRQGWPHGKAFEISLPGWMVSFISVASLFFFSLLCHILPFTNLLTLA